MGVVDQGYKFPNTTIEIVRQTQVPTPQLATLSQVIIGPMSKMGSGTVATLSYKSPNQTISLPNFDSSVQPYHNILDNTDVTTFYRELANVFMMTGMKNEFDGDFDSLKDALWVYSGDGGSTDNMCGIKCVITKGSFEYRHKAFNTDPFTNGQFDLAVLQETQESGTITIDSSNYNILKIAASTNAPSGFNLSPMIRLTVGSYTGYFVANAVITGGSQTAIVLEGGFAGQAGQAADSLYYLTVNGDVIPDSVRTLYSNDNGDQITSYTDDKLYLPSTVITNLVNAGISAGDFLELKVSDGTNTFNFYTQVKTIDSANGYIQITRKLDDIYSDMETAADVVGKSDFPDTAKYYYLVAAYKNLDGASVNVSWYAYDSTNALTVQEVTSSNISSFGDNDPRNPLGFAVNLASSSAVPVYAINVSPDNYTAAQTVIDSSPNTFYFFHVLSSDPDVINSYIGYVNTRSDKDHKQWAVILIGNPVPESKEELGTGSGSINENDNVITLINGTVPSSLQAGDKVQVGTETFTVSSVLDDTSVLVVETASNTHSKESVRFYREYSNDKLAELTAQNAAAYGNSRVWAFPQRPVIQDGNDEITLDGGYLGIVHAAIYSAIPIRRPKKGLGYTGFYKLKDSLGDFTWSQLEKMAQGGNTVYIMPVVNGACYTPDGLTTDMTGENTRYQNVIMQVDAFAYMVSSLFTSITVNGRYLQFEAERIIMSAWEKVYGLATAGYEPIVGRGTRITQIEPDPAHPNTGFIVTFEVEIQYPFNYLTITILA